MSDYLEIAREHLCRRAEPSEPSTSALVENDLKGAAVLIVCEALGEVRLWIVADDEDAAYLHRGGDILERSEARELVRVADPVAVHSILEFKRRMSGRQGSTR